MRFMPRIYVKHTLLSREKCDVRPILSGFSGTLMPKRQGVALTGGAGAMALPRPSHTLFPFPCPTRTGIKRAHRGTMSKLTD
jgi:hypothetical protein